MKKLIAIFFMLMLYGCVFKQPMMLEGTSLRLGCYIPWDGQMYGLEVMSFMSGTLITTQTNDTPSIEHSSSSTNSWLWGMLDSVEHTCSSVKFK